MNELNKLFKQVAKKYGLNYKDYDLSGKTFMGERSNRYKENWLAEKEVFSNPENFEEIFHQMVGEFGHLEVEDADAFLTSNPENFDEENLFFFKNDMYMFNIFYDESIKELEISYTEYNYETMCELVKDHVKAHPKFYNKMLPERRLKTLFQPEQMSGREFDYYFEATDRLQKKLQKPGNALINFKKEVKKEMMAANIFQQQPAN